MVNVEVKAFPEYPADKVQEELNSGTLNKTDYDIYDDVEILYRVWINNYLIEFSMDLYGVHIIEFNLNTWSYDYKLISIILQTIYDWSYKTTQDMMTIDFCNNQASILKNKLLNNLKDHDFTEVVHPCW